MMGLQERSVLTAALCLALTACGGSQPNARFDDGKGNIAWREALAVAGVAEPASSYYPRIAEMTLEQASLALGPCIELSADCGLLMLQTHPRLKDAQLKYAWPHSLGRMAPQLVPELLARGAKADGAALLAAMSRRRAEWPARQQIVKQLLLANAPVDAQDFDGHSALHLAARDGDAELVRLLLSFGADRQRLNRRGLSAYQLAMGQGAEEAASLLR
ncbi:ankyrin repeat domain-containing protein [Pseudomarimonas arenosa]|uniref:Ankyrin repeat domain-containing protein n=1 Tax=Pseudomarimonas arenosa TaxID=2774145 RepID=A0AAW3ZKV6_9GAMM|nr:ankyrin repeat domain-containing protein [Pseudomarimonas arenosa]MBD8525071.1 ankyrin repeat domain-containing protein [Pseudomarimonas arenosa]